MITLHFAPFLCQMNKSIKSGVKEKAGTSFAAQGESVNEHSQQEFMKIEPSQF